METVSKQRFACPSCAKRFVWKPQYAGRKVTCKCGTIFVAQLGVTQPLDIPLPSDVMEEVAPAPPPRPKATSTTPARTVDPRLVGLAGIPRSRSPRQMSAEDDDYSPARDLYLPMLLLAGALLFRLSQILLFSSGRSLGTGSAVGLLACELIVTTAALFLGAIASASFIGVELGTPGTAALKLAAIAIFASAVGYICAQMDRDPENIRGIVLALHVVMIVEFILIAWLFKTDLLEGLMTTVIIFVVQLIMMFAVSRALSPDGARALFFGS